MQIGEEQEEFEILPEEEEQPVVLPELAIACVQSSQVTGWLWAAQSGPIAVTMSGGSPGASKPVSLPHADGWPARAGRNSPHPRSGAGPRGRRQAKREVDAS
jgi:hypothetical protein